MLWKEVKSDSRPKSRCSPCKKVFASLILFLVTPPRSLRSRPRPSRGGGCAIIYFRANPGGGGVTKNSIPPNERLASSRVYLIIGATAGGITYRNRYNLRATKQPPTQPSSFKQQSPAGVIFLTFPFSRQISFHNGLCAFFGWALADRICRLSHSIHFVSPSPKPIIFRI